MFIVFINSSKTLLLDSLQHIMVCVWDADLYYNIFIKIF